MTGDWVVDFYLGTVLISILILVAFASWFALTVDKDTSKKS